MFICKLTETIEHTKSNLIFLKIQTLQVKNSRILRIKNFEFSGYFLI